MTQYHPTKRKPGGQPRNLNAMKHGLYSKPPRCTCFPEEFYDCFDDPADADPEESYTEVPCDLILDSLELSDAELEEFFEGFKP